MKRNIYYRNYEEKDYEGALNMVLETWEYYDWVPKRAARAMGSYYLSEILAISDVVWVAEENGVPVGIAAVKNEKNGTNHLRYRLRQMKDFLKIMLCGQGKTEFFQFMKTEKLNDRLLAESGREFDAELSLLIVRGDKKGLGIGGSLYQRFLSYLEQEKLGSFYLFTDSSCDYEFYERKKLKRIRQKTFYWKDSEGECEEEDLEEEYYLYCN